jgi:hypothetical protein
MSLSLTPGRSSDTSLRLLACACLLLGSSEVSPPLDAAGPTTSIVVDASSPALQAALATTSLNADEQIPTSVHQHIATTASRSPLELVRCLFLHGFASDASIQRIIMQATSWLGKRIEFIFIDGPHSGEARPELFESLYEAGIYERDKEYRDWGFGGADATSRVARSIASIEARHKPEPTTPMRAPFCVLLFAALHA